MQPTRHAYGALLLEQGHAEKAAAVYEADLGIGSTLPRSLQHPNNVWALHGYHECLMKLGRISEGRVVEEQLKLAIGAADIPVRSSCFCRLNTSKDATNLQQHQPSNDQANEGESKRRGPEARTVVNEEPAPMNRLKTGLEELSSLR